MIEGNSLNLVIMVIKIALNALKGQGFKHDLHCPRYIIILFVFMMNFSSTKAYGSNLQVQHL